MARYFMNLRDGTDVLLDPEGIEQESLDGVRAVALREARELISADAKTGVINLKYRIDAEDQDGAVVHSLRFTDALDIIAA